MPQIIQVILIITLSLAASIGTLIALVVVIARGAKKDSDQSILMRSLGLYKGMTYSQVTYILGNPSRENRISEFILEAEWYASPHMPHMPPIIVSFARGILTDVKRPV